MTEEQIKRHEEALRAYTEKYAVQASAGWVQPDPVQPRDRYKTTVERIDDGEGHWSYGRNLVSEVNPETGSAIREVGEFTYHYSGRAPFEPFRQLRDGAWRDYALCSEDYTQLSCMDLATGEVIAVEPHPRISQDRQDRILRHSKTDEERQKVRDEYPVGQEMPGAGFCPVSAWVPDFFEVLDDSCVPGEHWVPEYERLSGEFGVYCGCVWGDDSSWKIQYVDLSRVSEGVLVTDDRFGYVELCGPASSLRDLASYSTETDRFTFPVAVQFNRESGKASAWARDTINWDEKS